MATKGVLVSVFVFSSAQREESRQDFFRALATEVFPINQCIQQCTGMLAGFVGSNFIFTIITSRFVEVTRKPAQEIILFFHVLDRVLIKLLIVIVDMLRIFKKNHVRKCHL